MTTIDDDRNASLLRWALKTRRAMRPSGTDSFLHVWLLRPALLAVACLILFGLTYLAAAFRPRLLYAANEIHHNNLAHRTAFLDCRVFTVSSLAVFQTLTGSALLDEFVAQPRLTSIKATFFAIHPAVLYCLLLSLILLPALQVWIGSRAAKAPLSISQSAKVSGYGLATILISVSILMSIYPAITILDREMHVFFDVLAIIATVLLLVSFVGFANYVTFIGPVTAYHPDVDRAKLRFGWLVGSIVGYFMPLVVGLLAVVFAFVSGSSGSATP